MKRRSLNIIPVVLFCFLLYACGEKKQAPNPASIPVPVNISVVFPERALYHDKFPGTVTAVMQVDIKPEVEGYVTGIFFKEGEHVRKGQKLYSIDDSKYLASYNQAQANVRVAESNLEQAQKDADRYVFLNQHEAVAKQLLDHAMTTLQNAKNQVTASKQDLRKAQTDLGYSIIKAPFDGTIGISQVKLGNTVVPGQTVMNTISTDDPMMVDFVVNENQIPRFVKLQKEKRTARDSIFTIAMADNSIYEYPGQVSVIDRGVNPQTGALIVRLAFPNPHGILRTGMSCNVRVKNDDTAQQLVIPAKAIVEQMGEFFVFVAKDTILPSTDTTKKKEPAQPSLRAIQRKVVQGQTIADRVVIKTGLSSGDSVIVEGVQKLHQGSLITLGKAGQK